MERWLRDYPDILTMDPRIREAFWKGAFDPAFGISRRKFSGKLDSVGLAGMRMIRCFVL